MMENLLEDEMPPESIWHSYLKCKKWIEDHRHGGKNNNSFLEFKDTEVEKAS